MLTEVAWRRAILEALLRDGIAVFSKEPGDGPIGGSVTAIDLPKVYPIYLVEETPDILSVFYAANLGPLQESDHFFRARIVEWDVLLDVVHWVNSDS